MGALFSLYTPSKGGGMNERKVIDTLIVQSSTILLSPFKVVMLLSISCNTTQCFFFLGDKINKILFNFKKVQPPQ